MKNIKIISIIVLFACVLGLTACADIKGDYVQLSSPFGTNDISSNSNGDETVSQPLQSSSDTNSSVNTAVEYAKTDLVRVTDFIPDIVVDIKYATADNFTDKKIYNFNDAYLRYGTVQKLSIACDSLRKQGFKLIIWDAYRPQEAQYTLYESASDADKAFLSNPDKKSLHSAGRTIDVSMVKFDGSAVEMPTGFDNFTKKADRDYSDVSKEAGKNSAILEKALTEAGFSPNQKEWWHYSDTDKYDFDDIKSVKLANKDKKLFTADCNEFISLRKGLDKESDILCKVTKDSTMKPVAWYDGYVKVIYGDFVGFVSNDYIK